MGLRFTAGAVGFDNKANIEYLQICGVVLPVCEVDVRLASGRRGWQSDQSGGTVALVERSGPDLPL